MKLASIQRDGEAHLVCRVGERAMVDVTAAAGRPAFADWGLPACLDELVARHATQGPAAALKPLRRLVDWSEQLLARDGDETARRQLILDPADSHIAWLPPVLRPEKILCVGLNYWDHCREQQVEPPPRPILFGKWPNALNAHRRPIALAPGSERVDFEAELAVIVGRALRGTPDDEALDGVFGYTTFNDVTARDFQRGDGQWLRGKSQDTFAPVGPWVVTVDEIPDPQRLPIRCRVNGVTLQDSTTAEMIFPVRHLLAFISQGITLRPGDILATGTPDGVGVFRKPPVFLKPGDRIEVTIEGIGTLENSVVAAGEAGPLSLPLAARSFQSAAVTP